MAFPFDFRLRTPEGSLGRAVASVWYARGTIPYRREKVAPTGSSVAVIVLGDPIIETAGGPRAVPVRATEGFLIGPHDRPVTNEPTGETFAVGIVTTPVGARAALGVEPATIAGRVVDLAPAWPPATDLRRDLLAVADDPETMLDLVEARLAGRPPPRRPRPRPLRARRRPPRRRPHPPDRRSRRGSSASATATSTASSRGSSACRRGDSHVCCGWNDCSRGSRSTPPCPGRTSPRTSAGRTSRT